MWYYCFSTSGRHYGFRAIGIATRYYKGKFQIKIDCFEELNLICRTFCCSIVYNANELEIYDDYRE